MGGTAPCILNASDEVAVEAFLAGRISFTGIAEVIDHTLEALPEPRSAASTISSTPMLLPVSTPAA